MNTKAVRVELRLEIDADAYELAYGEKWGLDANRYTRAIVDSIVREAVKPEWIEGVSVVAPS